MDGLGIHIDRFVTLREHAQKAHEHGTKWRFRVFGRIAKITHRNASPLLHCVALKILFMSPQIKLRNKFGTCCFDRIGALFGQTGAEIAAIGCSKRFPGRL
jgi:hypothetical protein